MKCILKHKCNSIIIVGLYILLGSISVYCQTISPQKLPFTKICAQSDFNTFDADFIFSGFPGSTTFIVELSDSTGSFTTPTATTTLTTTILSASEQIITFAVPTNLLGSEVYKLRVKSSTGVVSGNFYSFDLKTSFPAYYKPFSGSFYINDQLPNLSLCNGGSATLDVDNPTPSIPNSSPANFSNLKYNWYKDNVLISGTTGTSLVVNSIGTYYVEINYGACTDSNFRSQDVIVTGSAGSVATITSSLSNPFCASAGSTTLTATSGNTYLWKKDNVVIPGAISKTYITNLPGVYKVDVDFGGCKSTGTITLKVVEISASIDVPDISSIVEGGSKVVTVTTDASNPTYKWYLDGLLIPGETSSSYTVITVGDYKVEVTQNTGCIITKEIPFTINSNVVVNAIEIPNLISPNNDGFNDFWVIPQQYSSGTNTKVVIMSSYGEIVLETNDYQNNWPDYIIDFKNVNPIYYYIVTPQDGSVKKGSITIIK